MSNLYFIEHALNLLIENLMVYIPIKKMIVYNDSQASVVFLMVLSRICIYIGSIENL